MRTPDFHTLDSSTSGNLHGVPLAYATGQPGFEGCFPPLAAKVEPTRVRAFGVRSIDPAERIAVDEAGVTLHDMRAMDEHGVGPLLRDFLGRVSAENGLLHVSLDVDFLDPSIAPRSAPPSPAARRSGRHTWSWRCCTTAAASPASIWSSSIPLLDERGRTAILMVDLVASLMGRRIMDRPTRSYWRWKTAP